MSTSVVADGSSVVSTREITDVTGKSLRMKIEIESGPGSHPPVNAVGHQYAAFGGSAICADKISGVKVDDDIDLSITVRQSQTCAGTVGEKLHSLPKGPAVDRITEQKVELIDCLMADHSFILQHVHAKRIITDREYQNMMHLSQPEKTVTELIDRVIFKGQESCCLFLEVLKTPTVLETYPRLKKMTANF